MISQYTIQKTEAAYLRSIRAAITGLWRGQLSYDAFISAMQSAITRAYNQAGIEGAKLCGIKPNEMGDAEREKIRELITNESQYIDGLASDVEENSKANGGKLDSVLYRANYWTSRYEQVKQAVRMVSCSDRKYEWRYGDTRHCVDCLNLNGRVYRGSVWANYIQPQSSQLSCFGIRCQCGLYETDKPLTPGKPPAIKGPRKRKKR